jgi:hypothetical protein
MVCDSSAVGLTIAAGTSPGTPSVWSAVLMWSSASRRRLIATLGSAASAR